MEDSSSFVRMGSGVQSAGIVAKAAHLQQHHPVRAPAEVSAAPLLIQLLTVAWEKQRKMAQVFGFLYPQGKPRKSCWFLTSFCPIPEVEQQAGSLPLSLSLFQINKLVILKKVSSRNVEEQTGDGKKSPPHC